MSAKFFVYALRVKGEMEARYIGQSKQPERRLYEVVWEALRAGCPTANDLWLRANRHRLELAILHECESREEAKKVEAEAIRLFAAMGHRLVNCHHNREKPLSRSGIAA